jgi:hypothetical protein
MHELLEAANDVGFQHLVSRYLRLEDGETIWSIADAGIGVEDARHRTGVPPDARCVRYEVMHPDQEWSFKGRAVWRGGKLLEPTATHTCIETISATKGRYASDDAVAEVINDWLKSL